MDEGRRHRLDDLRRLATALATAAGLAPARAAAFASHLLWFDAAGLPRFGIATLPDWLDRVQAGEVHPRAEGVVLRPERAGTAILDGQGGLGPLILARGAAIAAEKARDAGVGLVRVRGVGAVGPPAPIAADLALGPLAALVVGPPPARAVALPSADGLPLVYDASLAEGPPEAPALDLLAPEGEWLVQAVSVAAIEPLSSLHQRAATAPADGPGWLSPRAWDAHRRSARERGLGLAASDRLRDWADRLGVPFP